MEIRQYVCFYEEGGEVLSENSQIRSQLGLRPHIPDESQTWFGGLGSDSPKATQRVGTGLGQEPNPGTIKVSRGKGITLEEWGGSAPFFPDKSTTGGVGSHRGCALLWRHATLLKFLSYNLHTRASKFRCFFCTIL